MSYFIKEIFLSIQGEGANSGRAAIFCRFSGCNLWSGKSEDREKALCSFCDTDFQGTNGTSGGIFETPAELIKEITAQWHPVSDRKHLYPYDWVCPPRIANARKVRGTAPKHIRRPWLFGGIHPIVGIAAKDIRHPWLFGGIHPIVGIERFCRVNTPKKSGTMRGFRARPLVVCTGGEPLLQMDAPLFSGLHQAGFEVAVETNGTIEAPEHIDWLTVSPKSGTTLLLKQGDELKLVFPQKNLDPESFVDLDFKHFFLQPMSGPDREKNTRLAIEYCLSNPVWRLGIQLHTYLGIR